MAAVGNKVRTTEDGSDFFRKDDTAVLVKQDRYGGWWADFDQTENTSIRIKLPERTAVWYIGRDVDFRVIA